jgi:glycosyltransferase involved in cell wall biosynthesis
LGIGDVINRLMPAIPFMRWFGAAAIVVLRPIVPSPPPSLTIVIPCRNEKGNIESALTRLPAFAAPVEIIFVEGHSNDGTWDEVRRVVAAYESKFKIAAYQQTGKGKSDAVRLGFSKASHDLLTILDADLTMPPEMMPRFYNAYCAGLADFINGTRLVYPMEGEAMRFLNRLGNVFFAKALSFVLDAHLTDSLCGTKLLRRDDYQRMIRWRGDFGDFDPFGDFELLFPAAILGLGLIDVPVYYRARTYGATNIHRFRHGLMLLRMTLIGWLRVKCGAGLRP